MEPSKEHYEAAETELICDVDTLSDWLCADCIDSRVTQMPRPFLEPELMTQAQLLAAVFGSPYPGFVFACAQELRERFLQERMGQIEQRAWEIYEAVQRDAREKKQEDALAVALGK